MTLSAAGPAGTPHDPFAGSTGDSGERREFPADRYIAVGASEQELIDLSAYFDSLSPQEQRDALAWHDAQDDAAVTVSLDRFREARDAYAALGGLSDDERAALDALTDEERAQLHALSPDERAELSAHAAEQTGDDEQAAYDALSDDDKAALAALTPEQLAELRPEPADGGATSAAQTSAADTGTSDAGQPDSAAQTAADGEKPRFTTDEIADLTIPQVEQLIGKGDVTAADALAAEQARGEKARPKLIEKLTALAAE